VWRCYDFENKIFEKIFRITQGREKIFIPMGWKLSCDTEQWVSMLLYRKPSFQKITLLNHRQKTAYRNAKQVSGLNVPIFLQRFLIWKDLCDDGNSQMISLHSLRAFGVPDRNNQFDSKGVGCKFQGSINYNTSHFPSMSQP